LGQRRLLELGQVPLNHAKPQAGTRVALLNPPNVSYIVTPPTWACAPAGTLVKNHKNFYGFLRLCSSRNGLRREIRSSVEAATEQAAIAALLNRNLLVVSIQGKLGKKGKSSGGKVGLAIWFILPAN